MRYMMVPGIDVEFDWGGRCREGCRVDVGRDVVEGVENKRQFWRLAIFSTATIKWPNLPVEELRLKHSSLIKI